MSREGGVQKFSVKNIAGTAPRAGTASEGIMVVSVVSDEEVAALRAELERAKSERKLQKRAYEAELERLQYEVDLEWLQYGMELKWRQSETVDMPMFPLLEGPEQSAPTTVALAAEAPAAEVTTDNRVVPDTAAPDASVERAATKLTSAAGSSSKISGERRASTGTLFPLAVRYKNNSGSSGNTIVSSSNGSNNNSSSNSNSSSSNNDTTTTCAVALLRPFDPGKGCQRDATIGAVLGLDLPFDSGKHDGEHSMEGDGIRAEAASVGAISHAW